MDFSDASRDILRPTVAGLLSTALTFCERFHRSERNSHITPTNVSKFEAVGCAEMSLIGKHHHYKAKN
jgi:hypothetical protein